MSVAVEERPLVLGTGRGGMPARRAVARWAWRLFRREWRQQAIVLILLVLAVAATTVGLAIGAAAPSEAWLFGTADNRATLGSTGPQIDADLAKLRSSFGTIDVIEHAKRIRMPGSANGLDLRAQDPDGPYGKPTLRLDKGRWPQGPVEVAVTQRAMKTFNLHLGGNWDVDGTTRTVVGLVENPLNLNDAFALVAPGQIADPQAVDVLIKASRDEYISKPRPDDMTTQRRAEDQNTAAVMVLVLATIGLVFVGLMAVAGFTVMAQRRLRALGMLGAIGASRRHIRLVMLANGVVIGGVGALTGAVTGVAGWAALGPLLEPLLGHRIDRFNVPWTPLGLAVLLAVITAVLAAWWPARAAARIPVVAALSDRPAPPRPAHRFALLGTLLLAGGLTSLYLSKGTKPPFIVGGVLATSVSLLLLAPVGIAAIGLLARHAPLAPRLAMRDLARYRARSGSALAAIALAVGIAATVALTAAASAAKAAAPTGGNLPADQVIVWLDPERTFGPVPVLTAEQEADVRKQVDAIAARLGATSVLPLAGAVDPNGPIDRENNGRPPVNLGVPRQEGDYTVDNGGGSISLFVATPELLAYYGIDPASVNADTDLLTSRSNLDGYKPFPVARNTAWAPKLQHVTLPDYGSLPNVLITTHAMTTLHVSAVPVGWLVKAPKAITAAQLDTAQQTAAGADLSIESRPTGTDARRIADDFTVAGVAVALGVLAMTVGLIRSETSRDLRTLTAAGAPRRTRRALTASTAGALSLTGAVIGTGCAYVALLVWYHRELHWLAHPPLVNLAAILVGLPIVAYLGGWLLAGKEMPAIARQAVD